MKMSDGNAKSFFDEPDVHRTLGLKVEDRTFWVSRESLAGYSPVFKKMLYGEFKEANQIVIPLPAKKAEAVQELLSCLFPTPSIKSIDYNNLQLILAFSDEYEIAVLHQWAEKFLQADVKDRASGDEKLLYILRVASKYSMRKLLPQCVKRCGVEFGLETLRPIIPFLRTEVVAGVSLYLAAAPTSLKCRYVYSPDPAPYRGCEAHNYSVKRMVCTYCGRLICAQCLASSTYKTDDCGVFLAHTDKTVEALLNRMYEYN